MALPMHAESDGRTRHTVSSRIASGRFGMERRRRGVQFNRLNQRRGRWGGRGRRRRRRCRHLVARGGRADRSYDVAVRRGGGRLDGRRDGHCFPLRSLEEPWQRLLPVLWREHFRERDYARDAQAAVAERLDDLRKPLHELRGGLPVMCGALGEPELPVEEVEEAAVLTRTIRRLPATTPPAPAPSLRSRVPSTTDPSTAIPDRRSPAPAAHPG